MEYWSNEKPCKESQCLFPMLYQYSITPLLQYSITPIFFFKMTGVAIREG